MFFLLGICIVLAVMLALNSIASLVASLVWKALELVQVLGLVRAGERTRLCALSWRRWNKHCAFCRPGVPTQEPRKNHRR